VCIFVGLADSVVVGVDPQTQVRENSITGVNDAVSVAAVLWIVVDSQRSEPVGR